MATKPRAVSAAIEPMTLEAIRERLELFREFGVKSAAFYGPHLTEVVFAPTVADDVGEADMGANEPELTPDALTRLASRGEKRLNREE